MVMILEELEKQYQLSNIIIIIVRFQFKIKVQMDSLYIFQVYNIFQWSRNGYTNSLRSFPIVFSTIFSLAYVPYDGEVNTDNAVLTSVSNSSVRFGQYGNNRTVWYIAIGI